MSGRDLRQRRPGTSALHLADLARSAAPGKPQRGRMASLVEANLVELSMLLGSRPELRVLTLPVLLYEAATWGA